MRKGKIQKDDKKYYALFFKSCAKVKKDSSRFFDIILLSVKFTKFEVQIIIKTEYNWFDGYRINETTEYSKFTMTLFPKSL